MDCKSAINIIITHREEMNQYGVASLSIFGSVARDNAELNSDVDVLVEFNKPVSLFEFMDFKEYLEKIFNRKVDLVTIDALKPQLKKQILDEAVHAA